MQKCPVFFLFSAVLPFMLDFQEETDRNSFDKMSPKSTFTKGILVFVFSFSFPKA